MKNQPICARAPSQPPRATSAAIANPQSTSPIASTRAKRPQVKRACSGVGVPSSMIAGPWPFAAAPCPPPARNLSGAMRPPICPSTPAPRTIAGNGRSSAKIATNAAAAIAHSAALRRARDPIRHAAKRTIAVTAGLMP